MKKILFPIVLALGVIAVIAAALAVSKADLRVGYVSGALAMTAAALVASREWLSVPVAALVVSAPALLFYRLAVIPQLPATWPTLLFWLAAAAAGAMLARRGVWRAGGWTAVVAVTFLSIWYVRAGIPRAITNSLLRTADSPAPHFVIQALDGGPITNQDLTGKTVVIDFFGTWCVPCRAELPELARLRRELAARPDIVFLAVANDSGGDTIDSVRQFAVTQPGGLRFAWDGRSAAHKAFGFTGVPAMIVLDRGGHVRIHREGYNSAESEFVSILRERLLQLDG